MQKRKEALVAQKYDRNECILTIFFPSLVHRDCLQKQQSKYTEKKTLSISWQRQ